MRQSDYHALGRGWSSSRSARLVSLNGLVAGWSPFTSTIHICTLSARSIDTEAFSFREDNARTFLSAQYSTPAALANTGPPPPAPPVPDEQVLQNDRTPGAWSTIGRTQVLKDNIGGHAISFHLRHDMLG